MKTRIGILGMGGVGGYFGGLLAKAYSDSKDIEIVFIARGETQKVIAQSGLKIQTDQEEFIAFPKVVSDNPEIIGKLDFLICATKTYDIEDSLLSIQKCVTKNTIILPLYNGVDATERISEMFPENEVLQGCVNVISKIISPAVIKKMSSFEKLHFGSRTASVYKLNALQTIFKNAGIDSNLAEDIEEAIWEKFIFISALASTTSYLDENIGAILNSNSSRSFYLSLLNEITLIAAVKGLNLPNDIILKTILKLEKAPKDETSSMHRDFMAGRKTELSSLTEFVIKEALKYEIDTPNYQLVFDKLKEVSN